MKKAILLTLFSLLVQLSPLQAVDQFRDLLATKYPTRFANQIQEYDGLVRDNKPLAIAHFLTNWKMRRIADHHEMIAQLHDKTNPRYAQLQEKYKALPESERDRLGNQNIFTEDMGAVHTSFGEWFQKRPAFKSGEGDLVLQARRALWRYKQLEMCGGVFKSFHSDFTFNPKSFSLDQYFIPLAQVKQSAPYYIFPEDFDQKMGDGKVTSKKLSSWANHEFELFDSLWRGAGVPPQYGQLIQAGKTHEADDYLKARVVMKTIERLKVGRGETLVYNPGTPFEKRPTQADLLATLKRKYTQHKTNGASNTDPVAGFEEFMGAAVEFVTKTKTNADLLERATNAANEGFQKIDQMLAAGVEDEQALKLLDARRKIQEGLNLIELDTKAAQEAWDKVWFTTSHPSLRAMTPLDAQSQRTFDILRDEIRDDMLSTWNKNAWSQTIAIEADSNLGEGEKFRRLRLQERAALAWWERRKNAGTFKAPEGSSEDLVAQYQWRDRTLFNAHKGAIMAGKPATAMILWDHDFTRATSTWEPHPLLRTMEIEAFGLFAKSKSSLTPQEAEEALDRWNIDTNDHFLQMLPLARAVPSHLSLPQILGELWANSRALPRIFRNDLPVVQADTDGGLWNDSLMSYLHAYHMLSPLVGPQIGGPATEITTTMRYLCDVREPDPITGGLQETMKQLYAIWKARSAASSFEDVSLAELSLFGQWIDCAAFTVSKIEPLLNTPPTNASWNILNLDVFQKFFAFEGDIEPNAPWRPAVERAREAWNQRASQVGR